MADGSRVPFHLKGNWGPVKDEVDALNLPIEGALPTELNGHFLRNGPNPISGQSPNWYAGQGMVHGLRLKDGKVDWYRNRYVRGGRYHHPEASHSFVPGQPMDRHMSNASTHILRHAGRVFALEEYSFPVEITQDLETKGVYDFDGKLAHGFSAHSKVCPETGELFSIGYGHVPPYYTFLRVSADGTFASAQEIPTNGPTNNHDFAITRTKAIFFDLPLIINFDMLKFGMTPFSWSDDYPARIGIMPRDGTPDDLTWYEVDPCFIFHVGNAYDDGEDVVLEACRFPEIMRIGSREPVHAQYWRFRFAPGADKATEEQLSDTSSEFPRIDDSRIGLPTRYAYMLEMHPKWGMICDGPIGLLKFDSRTGETVRHSFAPGRFPHEPVFAPAGGKSSSEDDGYIFTFVYDSATKSSSLDVYDASSFTSKPVARVALPQRVPFGFHGAWLPDED